MEADQYEFSDHLPEEEIRTKKTAVWPVTGVMSTLTRADFDEDIIEKYIEKVKLNEIAKFWYSDRHYYEGTLTDWATMPQPQIPAPSTIGITLNNTNNLVREEEITPTQPQPASVILRK